MFSHADVKQNKKYLELLSISYPTIQTASTEIINLTAILNLPKGTEHFISDLHGEYEVFTHIVKNASGSIKRKIDICFEDTISEQEKNLLATVIYYPQEKIAHMRKLGLCSAEWYKKILMQLVVVCRVVTSKYTRSKVRKALPEDFMYIIDELLYTDNYELNKQEYFDNILDTIISIGRADGFIIELSNLLQKMVVDKLHIIGDIFDRGVGAHLILEDLCAHRNVDIQWGNHDVLWMAAALGHTAAIANVVRNSIRYNNFNCLEDGYGINIRPLAVFALEQYRDDPCEFFAPKTAHASENNSEIERQNSELAIKVHKAITIIQMKLEGQIIQKRPEFKMRNRLLLHQIDTANGTIEIDGVVYELNDKTFPTVDMENPYELTADEQTVMQQLQFSFVHSKLLHKHINFLFEKGGIYRVHNGNLLYHGCIPMHVDGTFASLELGGKEYAAKELMDLCEKMCRIGAYSSDGEQKQFGLDFMWYLWCGPVSPLNGKTKMATFERAFLNDETTWAEQKDAYYNHIKSEETALTILGEFGIAGESSHIINGHVPVNIKKGESPIKSNGKVLIIDGGISKAYQKVTGISGYTLISNSYQLLIAEHHPFKGVDAVIENNDDMHSKNILVEAYQKRYTISDTDSGNKIKSKINDLKMLLHAYKTGIIQQAGL